MRYSLATKR